MADHPLIGGTASVGIFLLAFLIRYTLDKELPPGFPYITFFPAIVISTFVLGTSAGILCAVLSFLAAWYFFLPPTLSFSLSGQTALALGLFVFIVAVEIFIIDRMFGALDDLGAARAQAVQLAEQRDDLFKELQHRVGNNLNMIAAMLSIQSRGLVDETARHALGETARRISLVADINRMFHDPAHADGVLDNTFVQELGAKCIDAAGMGERVALSVDVNALAFRQDEFLPLSLVLAEYINNALEHGIGEAPAGNLRVTLGHEGDEAVLVVENDGKPLAEGFDARKPRSIGLLLVSSFARQLGGTFEISGGSITRSVLRFPLARAITSPPADPVCPPGALAQPA